MRKQTCCSLCFTPIQPHFLMVVACWPINHLMIYRFVQSMNFVSTPMSGSSRRKTPWRTAPHVLLHAHHLFFLTSVTKQTNNASEFVTLEEILCCKHLKLWSLVSEVLTVWASTMQDHHISYVKYWVFCCYHTVPGSSNNYLITSLILLTSFYRSFLWSLRGDLKKF